MDGVGYFSRLRHDACTVTLWGHESTLLSKCQEFDENSFSAFILMPVSLCESSFHKRLKVLYAFNQRSRCDDVTVLRTNSGALGMF